MEKGFIKGYPLGANITILSTIYLRPMKMPDGKYSPDYLYIVYKDLDTGEKKQQCIENPMYRYYIAKPNTNITHNLLFIDKDLVRPVECRYRDLKYSIAKETGNMEWFRENIRNGNYKANDKLLQIPTVFSADMNVEDFYRAEFDRLYKNEPFNPTKAYFDIEVDARSAKGDFPEMGECPVNAINLIDTINMVNYAFLLEDPNNPQIQQLKSTPNLGQMAKEFVQKHVGGWKQEARFGLDKYEYKVIFFADEFAMIKSFFRLMNHINPDFALAWNMAFDIPYLLARIKAFGYDPAEIVSHPDFEHKHAEYFIDTKADKYAERDDHAIITCMIVYMCQMILFASRRKGQRDIGTYKLDDIGNIIAKVRKVDYSHITNNILYLSVLNYLLFWLYNTMDTTVQYCVEFRVNDVDFVFTKALVNNTRYAKVHRQTVYLVNRINKDFYSYNYIMGDNINKNNVKVGFVGAFTSDPKLVSDKPKIKINGRAINVIPTANDYDYTALYPSIIDQNNIAPNTMHGKIIFDRQIDPRENKFGTSTFNRVVWFIEDLLSGHYIDFCQRYMNLPGYEQMYDLVLYYFTHNRNISTLRLYDNITGMRYMCHTVDPNKNMRELARVVDNSSGLRNMVIIQERMPTYDASIVS